jgi:hypothetical protein
VILVASKLCSMKIMLSLMSSIIIHSFNGVHSVVSHVLMGMCYRRFHGRGHRDGFEAFNGLVCAVNGDTRIIYEALASFLLIMSNKNRNFS